jgi:hypothetical protein
MTISSNVTKSAAIEPTESLADLNLVRSYDLGGEKKVEIFFSSTEGTKTFVYENGKMTELHFTQSGIPSELRYSFYKLKSYLEDTYATYNRGKVFINFRLRGGNHTSSHHTQSFNKTPPPPSRVHINYSGGCLITGLNRPEIQGGKFVKESGGIGKRNYSVVFETYNAALKPSVTLTLDKKECKASEIRSLELIKDRVVSDINNKKTESANLQSRVASITSLRGDNIAQQERHSQELRELESSNEDEAALHLQERELDAVRLRFGELSGKIQALISFFKLNETHNLGIDLHSEALSLFFTNQPEINQLIGTEVDTSTLMGKCVFSESLWLEESRKSVGKDIVALIGNTGAGKSTAINYLLGSEIFYDEQARAMRVAEGYEEFAKIGNRSSTSETLYTQICENSDFVFADCGGFLDTRGPEQEFRAMASLNATLSNSSTIKFVLCFDATILRTDRGVLFSNFVRAVFQDFLSDQSEVSESVMLMFTKPFFHRDGSLFSSADALVDIERMMEDTEDAALKSMYSFLLRDHAKYVTVCEPTEKICRASILERVSEMTPIQSKELFHIPCSSGLRDRLFEETTKIANQANELYEAFQRSSREVLRLQPLVAEKEARKRLLQAELDQLGRTIQNQASELSRVESSRARVLNEISQLQQKQNEKDGEIADLSSGIVTYRSNGGPWQIS